MLLVPSSMLAKSRLVAFDSALAAMQTRCVGRSDSTRSQIVDHVSADATDVPPYFNAIHGLRFMLVSDALRRIQ
jgi:hypothetical protein